AQGQLDEAVASYDLAIEVDPERAIAFRRRGLLRAKRGDPAGAASDLARAAELVPAWREELAPIESANQKLAHARQEEAEGVGIVRVVDGLRPGFAISKDGSRIAVAFHDEVSVVDVEDGESTRLE